MPGRHTSLRLCLCMEQADGAAPTIVTIDGAAAIKRLMLRLAPITRV